MGKYVEKIIKSILFYTIIFCILCFLSFVIVEAYRVSFLKPVYNIMLGIFLLGSFLGLVQLWRWIKVKKILLYIIIVIKIFISICIVYAYVTFYPTEEKTNINGNVYIKVIHHELISNDIEYYSYINSLVRGKNIKIQDDYTDGVGAHYLLATYYYDDYGNLVEMYDNKNKKMISMQNESEKKHEDNGLGSYTNQPNKDNGTDSYAKESTETITEPEILYEKKFDENKAIRVVCRDYILAQRSLVVFEKTYDGGATWVEQSENEDKFIQIHNGAKFVFINENVGFINDYGLAGTGGENRSLKVTTDGGKTFKDVTFIPRDYKEILYIDDVPYEDNGILKVKAHIIQDGQAVHYELFSKDNGLTWDFVYD